jgi:hypothetical protein
MDIGNRLLHRAYVLVEAEVPTSDAIEDLVSLAHGNVENLRDARDQAATGATGTDDFDPMTLELAGFEPRLLQIARMHRAALSDLLDRAIASFS